MSGTMAPAGSWWQSLLGVPRPGVSLLDDPRAMAGREAMASLTNTFGGLAAAFAPTTDPGARSRAFAAIGPLAQQARQGVRQDAMADRQMGLLRQQAEREGAINDAMSDRPDADLSPRAAQFRGLLAQMPERSRAVFGLLDPSQRGEFLGRMAQAQPRTGVVMSPGSQYFNPETGRAEFVVPHAPPAPRQPPIPGPYDHLRFAPDGSLIDLRQFGGGGAPRAPATPGAPGGMPPLAPPSAVLPPPGAATAGAAPMLSPEDADAAPTQMAGQGQQPPAALPPGVVRPPPPPEWRRLTAREAEAEGLPPLQPNQYYERGRDGRTVPRTVGGTGVTVTNNVGDRTTDKLVAEAWDAAEQAVRDGGRRATLYDRAERAIQSFRPGVTADARLFMGQLARELGIRVDGLAEGEVLRQVQRNLELAATPKGQGQITENERKLIRDGVPVWGNTPEGVRSGIQLLRRLDQIDADVARIYRENARSNGGTPNPVTVREQIAEYFRANPMPDVNQELSGYETPMRRDINAEPPQPPAPPRPRARNARGDEVEFDGRAWVPVR